MQHGLAGHPEGGGGLVEPDPSLGDGGDDVVAESLVEPDPSLGDGGDDLVAEGLVEPDPSLGDGGDDVAAEGLVDPDSPRGASGGLFTGDEPIAEPSIDGDLADAEEAFSFGNGDHDSIITVIIAVGGDSIWRPVAGDA